jgi:hypothetical protein
MGLVASKDTEQAHHRDDKETVKKKWYPCFFLFLPSFLHLLRLVWQKRGVGARKGKGIYTTHSIIMAQSVLVGVSKRHGI